MKTLKFLFVLCFILVFSAKDAVSQKVTGESTVSWRFTPGTGRFQIPCLTEAVSGTVTEYQSFTNNTYHVKPRGILYGESSGEEYTLDYEYNSFGINFESGLSDGSEGATHYLYINSLLLKHSGKLVAVIHLNGRYVINGNGEVVIPDLNFYTVNCK